jgi:hypothetical protein
MVPTRSQRLVTRLSSWRLATAKRLSPSTGWSLPIWTLIVPSRLHSLLEEDALRWHHLPRHSKLGPRLLLTQHRHSSQRARLEQAEWLGYLIATSRPDQHLWGGLCGGRLFRPVISPFSDRRSLFTFMHFPIGDLCLPFFVDSLMLFFSETRDNNEIYAIKLDRYILINTKMCFYFLPALSVVTCHFVQRGSTFCFVVVLGVNLLIILHFWPISPCIAYCTIASPLPGSPAALQK